MLRIVLDIDGTLIKIPDGSSTVTLRPYVIEFLNFCFNTFEKVSIWTAATPEWARFVLAHLTVSNGGKEFPFDFVYSREKCSTKIIQNSFYPEQMYIKPLRKVWKSCPGYDRHNTVIVDDIPETFQDNYGNGIPITSYFGGFDENLINLISFLTNLNEIYKECSTIRYVDKRNWMNNFNLLFEEDLENVYSDYDSDEYHDSDEPIEVSDCVPLQEIMLE